jgi:hypothetical protein
MFKRYNSQNQLCRYNLDTGSKTAENVRRQLGKVEYGLGKG